jgi:hypothetical protein
MTRAEKIKLFFQSFPSKEKSTAQVIRDAAAAVGDYSDIRDVITGYISGKGIKGTAKLLADLSDAQE